MGQIPHLYVPGPWGESDLPLTEEQLHHLRRVLRRGEDDLVSYTDGAGRIGQGRVRNEMVARETESELPRPTDLTVAVAPPGSRQRARFLVEKLAELGVARLLWIRTRRTEGRPPPAEKTHAWARAALEQSRGAWIMQIDGAAIEELDPSRLVVADPEGGGLSARGGEILLVGPEGGLEADEAPQGARRVGLGPTVLRVETAAIVGAALLGPLRPPDG